MLKIAKIMKRLVRDEKGVSAVEYAILAVGIVAAVSAATTGFKDSLGNKFNAIFTTP